MNNTLLTSIIHMILFNISIVSHRAKNTRIIFGLAIFVAGKLTDGFCVPLSTETTIPRPPGWVFGPHRVIG